MRYLCYCLFALVFSHAALAAEIPGSTFKSGNWKGSAYTGATGEFGYCLIEASYNGGDSLFFSVNRDATISVAIHNPAADFVAGREFPVTLKVDRRAPFYGVAKAASEATAILHLQDFDRAMAAFRKGFYLKITAGNREGVYGLKGTFRALEAAKQCARSYYSYVEVRRNDADTQPAAKVDKSLLYQIATGMITEIGITDFKYLSDAEVKEFTTDEAVLWKSSSARLIGGVYLRPLGKIRKLRETDAADLQEISGGCDGDILSGARKIDTGEFPAREMRAICSSETIVMETIVTKMLLDEFVVYTVLLFTDPQEPTVAVEEDRRQLSEDVTTRAASFLASSR
jgi:hypothetical protein